MQVLARLKAQRSLPGGLMLAAWLVWQAIDAWSNIEFALEKAPVIWRVTSALGTYILPFLGAGWIIAFFAKPSVLPPWSRIGRVKRLLKEGAEIFAADPFPKFKDMDSVTEAAWRMTKAYSFVEMAFGKRAFEDMLEFQEEEREAYRAVGKEFSPAAAVAKHFRRLARKVKADDLRPGFLIPDSFEQFMRQDQWVPNSVVDR